LLLPVLYGGCQAVEAQRSTGPYYEHRGMWCGDYGLDPAQARVAARMALADLKMPVGREGVLPHGLFIDTQTPENREARLVIMPLGPDGQGARVGVRLTGFGTHRQECERLLDAIARNADDARGLSLGAAATVLPPPDRLPGAAPMPAPPPGAPAQQSSLPPQPVPVN
jgi:hypothetical protein